MLALGAAVVAVVSAGGTIAFGTPQSIALTGADGSGRQVVIQHGENPELSPDGRRILYTRTASGVYVADVDGTHARRVAAVSTDDIVATASWAPDGRRFVYENGGEIMVRALAGGPIRRLTHGSGRGGWNLHPAWSPDGSRIVYASTRGCAARYYYDCASELFVMNADGTGKRRITHDAHNDFTPAWSPDGRWIAFAKSRQPGATDVGGSTLPDNGACRLFVIRPDGRGLRRLTGAGEDAVFPTWSPSGAAIAFSRRQWRSGNWEIAIIRRDGGGERVVTHEADVGGGGAHHPSWR